MQKVNGVLFPTSPVQFVFKWKMKDYGTCGKIAGHHIKAYEFTWSFVELNYEWKLKHNGKWNIVATRNMIYLNIQRRAQRNKFRNVYLWYHVVEVSCLFSLILGDAFNLFYTVP